MHVACCRDWPKINQRKTHWHRMPNLIVHHCRFTKVITTISSCTITSWNRNMCSLVASWWLPFSQSWLPFSQSKCFRWTNFFVWSLWLGRRLLCCSPSLACSRMCHSRSVQKNKMCCLIPTISPTIMDMKNMPDLQEIHPGKETFATESWLLVRNSHPHQLITGEPGKTLLTFQYCILFVFTGVLKMVYYNPPKITV